jgi:hypothetical protein
MSLAKKKMDIGIYLLLSKHPRRRAWRERHGDQKIAALTRREEGSMGFWMKRWGTS